MFDLNAFEGFGLLYLLVNFGDDGLEIIFILELQLLMMAPTLVWRSPLEYFGEAEKDLRFPAGGLS